MSGIFPEIGVTAPNTQNAQTGDIAITGCEPLFYRNNCTTEVDPIAINAIMSEIINVVLMNGGKYDCSKLNNMALTLTALSKFCTLQAAADWHLDQDSVAGCFDSTNKRMTLRMLRNALGICGFDEATDPDLNDFVGMCVDGELAKVTLSRLIDIITGELPTPASAPAYRRGGQFWAERWGETQDDTRTLDVGTRNAFVIRADNEVLGGNFYIRLGGINIYAESAVFQRMQGGVWHCLSTNHGTDWYNTNQTGNTFGVVKASTSSPIGGDGTSGVGRVYDAVLLTPQI
jgi:hypothetical protein